MPLVTFKLVEYGTTEWRAEAYQDGEFFTDYSFTTEVAAAEFVGRRQSFYRRNPGAYLFLKT
tara:strand:+ start:255 stop:440 length:186 start_codon:yes stop_codon:yes gene_type:complete